MARPDNHDDNGGKYDDDGGKYDYDNMMLIMMLNMIMMIERLSMSKHLMALKSRGLICQDTAACVNCQKKKRLKLTDLKQPDTGQKVG